MAFNNTYKHTKARGIFRELMIETRTYAKEEENM